MPHDIALVDDHHMMRSGLAAMVNSIEGYRVTVEAANGQELIDAFRGTTVPAIAIVDLHMPVMDGYQTIAWLREHEPTVLPLALTFDATDDAMVKAVRVGARGFILKRARPALLKIALDSLMLTGYYHNDELHQSIVQSHGMKTSQERERERVLASITPREMEFLRYVCSEDEPTYEQIADSMAIHHRTVDKYREALFDKFGIKSKTGLVLFAMRWGIMP